MTTRPVVGAWAAGLLAGVLVAGVVGLLGSATRDPSPVLTAYDAVAAAARSVPAARGADGVAAAVNQRVGTLPSGIRVLVWETSERVGRPGRGTGNGPASVVDPETAARTVPLLAGSGEVIRGLVPVEGARPADAVAVAVAAPRGGSPWWLAAAAGLAAVLVVALTLLMTSRRRPAPTPAPLPLPGRGPTAPAPDPVLVEELMDLTAQLPEGLVWRGRRALECVGVRAFTADGQPVDPEQHHVVGVAEAAGGSEPGTVARTERAGFRTESAVLRPALVVVYADGGARR
jgi:hypothetical protein